MGVGGGAILCLEGCIVTIFWWLLESCDWSDIFEVLCYEGCRSSMQGNVQFGCQVCISCVTEEDDGKLWSSWPVAGPYSQMMYTAPPPHTPLRANTVSATELTAVYGSDRCFIVLPPDSFCRYCVKGMTFRHCKRWCSGHCECWIWAKPFIVVIQVIV